MGAAHGKHKENKEELKNLTMQLNVVKIEIRDLCDKLEKMRLNDERTEAAKLEMERIQAIIDAADTFVQEALEAKSKKGALRSVMKVAGATSLSKAIEVSGRSVQMQDTS